MVRRADRGTDCVPLSVMWEHGDDGNDECIFHNAKRHFPVAAVRRRPAEVKKKHQEKNNYFNKYFKYQ